MEEADDDLVGARLKALQYELYRLFSNLSSLDEMRRRGRKVGKLQFEPSHRFKMIAYDRSGPSILPKNDKFGFLHLSKTDHVPIRPHRAVEGDVEGVAIKHMPSGKWYACLFVDGGNGPPETMVIDSVADIGVGLEHCTVDSDGQEVDDPRHLKHELKKLHREQRHLSRKQKGPKSCEKQRTIIARTYEQICDQRNDFQRKLAGQYVEDYSLMVTEKLAPGAMVQNRHPARSIPDAAWSSLNQKLAYKAENAGRLFVQVEPRGTGQTFPACGRAEA